VLWFTTKVLPCIHFLCSSSSIEEEETKTIVLFAVPSTMTP
jgi:hypothetical protein